MRPRRAARAQRGGALDLGHVRMAAPRRVRKRLPRRGGVPQRRSQGPSGRHQTRRLDLRRDRRVDLLFHAPADPRRLVRGAAPAPPLPHHPPPPVSPSARPPPPTPPPIFPTTP